MVKYTFILIVIISTSFARSEAATTLSEFAGTYAIRGSATLTQAGKILARGKAALRLRSNSAGSGGRLSVSGRFRLGSVARPFSEFLTFGRKGGAFLSNLAPGYQDGLSAVGTRTFGTRRITADFPFALRTTSGTAEVQIHRQNRGKRHALRVTQTLATTALGSPVTWTFVAFRRR